MKTRYFIYVITALLAAESCNLDRFPETSVPESNYWNPSTVSDFEYAANGIIASVPTNWLDSRGDDLFRNKYPNDISAGTRKVPATSSDWTQPYKIIFRANRMIQNAPAEGEGLGEIDRFVGEAYFFRAYAYWLLLAKFGGVPILERTAETPEDPILYGARNSRSEVVEFIYSDLEKAFERLPEARKLERKDYGRVSKSAAKALLSRVALFEGSWEKYHDASLSTEHFDISAAAASWVMKNGGHTLYNEGAEPYKSLFDYPGEGCGEFILAKIYGFPDNQVLTHNAPYQYCVNYCVSRGFTNLYLNSDGTPYEDSPSLDIHYNDYFTDRDPRLSQTFIMRGVSNYTLGSFVPSNPGFTPRKFVRNDGVSDQPSTLDWPVIRYAEVLLNYAEALFERDGRISDDSLDVSINLLRNRVGMPRLDHNFTLRHNLDMLTEIRREREVELALEGFRYDDLRRWKTAETVLPAEVLGAKFTQGEWGSVSPSALEDRVNEDNVFIIESAESRFFDPEKDYLYPIPSNDIGQSGGAVVQNPNWK